LDDLEAAFGILIDELAAILAKNDPQGRFTTERAAYRLLISEEAVNGKLRYIPRFYTSAGRKHEMSVEGENQVPKDVAVAWAEDKGFNVSHIK